MIIPPPPQFPPPQSPPGQHHRPRPSGMWPWWAWVLLAATAAGGALAFEYLSDQNDNEGGGAGPRGGSVSFKFTDGVCDEFGLTGRFRNTGSSSFSGKVWAVALDSSGDTVARDEEIVFDLAPGATETVSFVWSLPSDPDRCKIESVEE